jgi:transcription antitermination protein NusB
MQSLYEWEFREFNDLNEIVDRNIAEFEKDVDQEYIRNVVFGIQKNWDAINAEISKAAPEWPLEQVAKVDKNILRVATYEMLNDEDVPPRVSINEAIEIAKTFGGESSPKFINGALGFIYRQHEEKLKPRDAR